MANWARALVFLCALLQVSLIAVDSRSARGAPGALKIETARLANGIDVFSQRDATAPFVAINVAIDVGRKHDPERLSGLARLIAKLMERASTRHVRAADRMAVLSSLGFHPWPVKVSVGVDATNIAVLVPRQAFELALWLLSDRIAFFADDISPLNLEQGIRELEAEEDRSLGEPTRRLSMAAVTAAFGGEGSSVGEVDFGSLKTLTPAHLRHFVRERYGANRMSIAVVGNVQSARVAELVGKYFGGLLAAKQGKLPERRLEAPSGPGSVELHDDVEGELFCRAWRTSAFMTDADLALDVIARLLLAQLGRELVEPRGPASWLYIQQASQMRGSVFNVCAHTKRAADMQAVRQSIDKALDKARQGAFVPAEVDAAKHRRQIETGGEIDDQENRAYQINASWRLRKDPAYYFKYSDAYGKVTAEALARVARTELPAPSQVVVTMTPGPRVPRTGGKLAQLPRVEQAVGRMAKDEEFRYLPPRLTTKQGASIPVATELQLASGARAFVQYRPGLRQLRVRMTVRWHDKPPCCGVPNLLALLGANAPYDQGTTLRDAINGLGGWVTRGGDDEISNLTAFLLPEQLEPAALAMVRAMKEGKLDAKALDLLRADALDELGKEGAREQLNAHAQQAMFPAGSRFQVDAAGRRRALEKLSVAALTRYRSRALTADSVTFSVVGPLRADEVQSRLEPASRRLAGARKAPSLPPPSLEQGVTLWDDPGQKEAVTVIYIPTDTAGTPGHANAVALRWFLGSSPIVEPSLATSLTQSGVGYADRYVNAESVGGRILFVDYMRTAPEQVVAVLEVYLQFMERLRSEALSPASVAAARREVSSWLVRENSTPRSMLGQLTAVASYDGSPRDMAQLLSSSRRITGDQLQATAKKYLVADNLTVVSLGPVAALEPAIEQLGFKVTTRRVSATSKKAKDEAPSP